MQFPHLTKFAEKRGIPKENLLKGFEAETDFHNKIATVQNYTERQLLYREIYRKVLPLYGRPQALSKQPVAHLFRNELAGKSILDLGSWLWGWGLFEGRSGYNATQAIIGH